MSAPVLEDLVEYAPSAPDEELRWHTVAVTKIASNERDRVQTFLAGREFYDCIGADTDDHDERFPVGSRCLYAVKLTAAEAADLAAGGEGTGEGNNVRAVELDSIGHATTAPGAGVIPAPASLRYLRADPASVDAAVWHGRDQIVAVLDSGTTKAVRDYMGWTLVGRAVFGDDPGAAEVWAGQKHGCAVAPCAVPPGGRLLDALITRQSTDGTVNAYASSVAAAMRWAVDQGARIINVSYSGFTAGTVWTDALDYVTAAGAQVFSSTGNDNVNTIGVPASYSRTYSDVHSSIAFDETTNARGTFSNYASDASGCAPGVGIVTLLPDATTTTVQGTSVSTPLMSLCCARGATSGRFTPRQVGAALKANTRDTGQPALRQGAGAYDLRRALTALRAIPTPGPRRNAAPTPSAEVSVDDWLSSGTSTPTAPSRVADAGSPVGAAQCLVTATTSGALYVYGPRFAVTPGQQWTVSAFMRRNRATGGRMYIQWFNSSGTLISNSSSPVTPTPVIDETQRLSTAGQVAPAGAVSARGLLYLSSVGSTLPDETRVDGWLYEPNDLVEPYFDGSYPSAIWAGAPHASPSTLVSTSAPPRPGALLLGA